MSAASRYAWVELDWGQRMDCTGAAMALLPWQRVNTVGSWSSASSITAIVSDPGTDFQFCTRVTPKERIIHASEASHGERREQYRSLREPQPRPSEFVGRWQAQTARTWPTLGIIMFNKRSKFPIIKIVLLETTSELRKINNKRGLCIVTDLSRLAVTGCIILYVAVIHGLRVW